MQRDARRAGARARRRDDSRRARDDRTIRVPLLDVGGRRAMARDAACFARGERRIGLADRRRLRRDRRRARRSSRARRARTSSDGVLHRRVRRGSELDRACSTPTRSLDAATAAIAEGEQNMKAERRQARHLPARRRSVRRRRARRSSACCATRRRTACPTCRRGSKACIEHRGEVIPVVDLRRRIELADASITPETRILVLNTSDGLDRRDRRRGARSRDVRPASVAPPPPLFRGLAARVHARHRQGRATSSSSCSTSIACCRAPTASRSSARVEAAEAARLRG